MAFKIEYNKIILILMLFGLPLITATNIDCNGKAFHCVNETHFMICVDFGTGVSETLDDYVIPCPPTTGCRLSNRYECEYLPVTTTVSPVGTSEVNNMVTQNANTLAWEPISVTGNGQKTNEVEHSEKYYNTLNVSTVLSESTQTIGAELTEVVTSPSPQDTIIETETGTQNYDVTTETVVILSTSIANNTTDSRVERNKAASTVASPVVTNEESAYYNAENGVTESFGSTNLIVGDTTTTADLPIISSEKYNVATIKDTILPSYLPTENTLNAVEVNETSEVSESEAILTLDNIDAETITVELNDTTFSTDLLSTTPSESSTTITSEAEVPRSSIVAEDISKVNISNVDSKLEGISTQDKNIIAETSTAEINGTYIFTEVGSSTPSETSTIINTEITPETEVPTSSVVVEEISNETSFTELPTTTITQSLTTITIETRVPSIVAEDISKVNKLNVDSELEAISTQDKNIIAETSTAEINDTYIVTEVGSSTPSETSTIITTVITPEAEVQTSSIIIEEISNETSFSVLPTTTTTQSFTTITIEAGVPASSIVAEGKVNISNVDSKLDAISTLDKNMVAENVTAETNKTTILTDLPSNAPSETSTILTTVITSEVEVPTSSIVVEEISNETSFTMLPITTTTQSSTTITIETGVTASSIVAKDISKVNISNVDSELEAIATQDKNIIAETSTADVNDTYILTDVGSSNPLETSTIITTVTPEAEVPTFSIVVEEISNETSFTILPTTTISQTFTTITKDTGVPASSYVAEEITTILPNTANMGNLNTIIKPETELISAIVTEEINTVMPQVANTANVNTIITSPTEVPTTASVIVEKSVTSSDVVIDNSANEYVSSLGIPETEAISTLNNNIVEETVTAEINYINTFTDLPSTMPLETSTMISTVITPQIEVQTSSIVTEERRNDILPGTSTSESLNDIIIPEAKVSKPSLDTGKTNVLTSSLATTQIRDGTIVTTLPFTETTDKITTVIISELPIAVEETNYNKYSTMMSIGTSTESFISTTDKTKITTSSLVTELIANDTSFTELPNTTTSKTDPTVMTPKPELPPYVFTENISYVTSSVFYNDKTPEIVTAGSTLEFEVQTSTIVTEKIDTDSTVSSNKKTTEIVPTVLAQKSEVTTSTFISEEIRNDTGYTDFSYNITTETTTTGSTIESEVPISTLVTEVVKDDISSTVFSKDKSTDIVSTGSMLESETPASAFIEEEKRNDSIVIVFFNNKTTEIITVDTTLISETPASVLVAEEIKNDTSATVFTNNKTTEIVTGSSMLESKAPASIFVAEEIRNETSATVLFNDPTAETVTIGLTPKSKVPTTAFVTEEIRKYTRSSDVSDNSTTETVTTVLTPKSEVTTSTFVSEEIRKDTAFTDFSNTSTTKTTTTGSTLESEVPISTLVTEVIKDDISSTVFSNDKTSDTVTTEITTSSLVLSNLDQIEDKKIDTVSDLKPNMVINSITVTERTEIGNVDSTTQVAESFNTIESTLNKDVSQSNNDAAVDFITVTSIFNDEINNKITNKSPKGTTQISSVGAKSINSNIFNSDTITGDKINKEDSSITKGYAEREFMNTKSIDIIGATTPIAQIHVIDNIFTLTKEGDQTTTTDLSTPFDKNYVNRTAQEDLKLNNQQIHHTISYKPKVSVLENLKTVVTSQDNGLVLDLNVNSMLSSFSSAKPDGFDNTNVATKLPIYSESNASIDKKILRFRTEAYNNTRKIGVADKILNSTETAKITNTATPVLNSDRTSTSVTSTDVISMKEPTIATNSDVSSPKLTEKQVKIDISNTDNPLKDLILNAQPPHDKIQNTNVTFADPNLLASNTIDQSVKATVSLLLASSLNSSGTTNSNTARTNNSYLLTTIKGNSSTTLTISNIFDGVSKTDLNKSLDTTAYTSEGNEDSGSNSNQSEVKIISSNMIPTNNTNDVYTESVSNSYTAEKVPGQQTQGNNVLTAPGNTPKAVILDSSSRVMNSNKNDATERRGTENYGYSTQKELGDSKTITTSNDNDAIKNTEATKHYVITSATGINEQQLVDVLDNNEDLHPITQDHSLSQGTTRSQQADSQFTTINKVVLNDFSTVEMNDKFYSTNTKNIDDMVNSNPIPAVIPQAVKQRINVIDKDYSNILPRNIQKKIVESTVSSASHNDVAPKLPQEGKLANSGTNTANSLENIKSISLPQDFSKHPTTNGQTDTTKFVISARDESFTTPIYRSSSSDSSIKSSSDLTDTTTIKTIPTQINYPKATSKSATKAIVASTPLANIDTTFASDKTITTTPERTIASSATVATDNIRTPTFNCFGRYRGRYADQEDCRKYYVCIGLFQPIIGICPGNTVFSDIYKQCTKNLSHCNRGSEFQCTSEGRFSDIYKNNIYYICVKDKVVGKFYRFKLQCQNGFYLNKTSMRCVEKKITQSISASVDSTSKNESDKSSINKSKEEKEKEKFECEEEGKFPYPGSCRKYYECRKKKSAFRKKTRKCDSDELFHQEKKKCVDVDSYEC